MLDKTNTNNKPKKAGRLDVTQAFSKVQLVQTRTAGVGGPVAEDAEQLVVETESRACPARWGNRGRLADQSPGRGWNSLLILSSTPRGEAKHRPETAG